MSDEKVRYRVIAKTFYGGRIVEPMSADGKPVYVFDRPGLAGPGSPFKEAPEEARDAAGENPSQVDAVADQDVARLTAALAEKDGQLAVAETAIADLQGRLDAERAAHDAKVAELEAMLAAATAPSGQKQSGASKGK